MLKPISKEQAKELELLRERIKVIVRKKVHTNQKRIKGEISWEQFRNTINELNIEREETIEKIRELRSR